MVLTRGMSNGTLPILDELFSNTVYFDDEVEHSVSSLYIELKKIAANLPHIDMSVVEINISYILKKLNTALVERRSSEERVDFLQDDIRRLTSQLDQEKHKRRIELDSSFNELDIANEQNFIISQANNNMSSSILNLKTKMNTISHECDSLKSLVEEKNSIIDQLSLNLQLLQKDKLELCSAVSELQNKLSRIDEDKWLDDAILQTFFSSFNNSDKAVSTRSLFLGPSVTELLKHGNMDDVNKQLRDINLDRYHYIFFCLNNTLNTKWQFKDGVPINYDGGSHWSLLFYVPSNKSFFHIDSFSNLNQASARSLLLNLNVDLKHLVEVSCPQQNNLFECGLNVLLYSKLILSGFCSADFNSNVDFLKWFEQFSNVHTTELQPHTSVHVSGVASVDVPSLVSESTSILDGNDSCEEWRTVSPRKCKDNNRVNKNVPKIVCSIPIERVVANNRFMPLSNSVSNSKVHRHSATDSKVRSKRSKVYKPLKLNKNMNSNHFIVSVKSPYIEQNAKKKARPPVDKCNAKPNRPIVKLFTDSHGRGISSIMLEKVNNKAVVTSWVKPSAKVEQLMDSLTLGAKGLNSGDLIVIIGGTNNIVNGHCNSFDEELGVVLGGISAPKIVLAGLPTRHDRPSLNGTVSEVNSRLRRLADQFNNVEFVSLETLPRSSFTKHGLHLNMQGKHSLADLLLSYTGLSMGNSISLSRSRTFSKAIPPYNRKTTQFNSCVQSNVAISHPGRYLGKQFISMKVAQSGNQLRPVQASTKSQQTTRTFTNNSFLGVANKPHGVPWAKYLEKLELTNQKF